jgi:hypothetical protein
MYKKLICALALTMFSYSAVAEHLPSNPDAQHRYDKFKELYDVVTDVSNQADTKWRKIDTCSFWCISNPGEDIANSMDIKYQWLSGFTKKRAGVLKYQITNGPYTKSDQVRLAQEQYNWSKDFQKKAYASEAYIRGLDDGYIWKGATYEASMGAKRGTEFFKKELARYKKANN